MNFGPVNICDVCEIVTGATPDTSEPKYWGGNIRWATPKDLSDLDGPTINETPRKITESGLQNCSATLLAPRSVLFSSRAPIGLVAINTVPMATNQGFKSFVPKRGRIDASYLYHWLRANRRQLEAMGNGATFKEVSKAVVERIELPVPHPTNPELSLAEQKRIAAILEKADAMRRKRREAIGFTNRVTTSLFQEMFGQWLQMPSSKMPRLGDPEIADIASGVTKGRRFNGQPTVIVPYIRVANVQDGFLNLAEIKTIEALPSDVESLRLQHGDVLMTEGGDFDKLGRGAMWEADIPDCIHQNHVFRVRCNQRNLLPIYFANYIRTEIARAYFLRCAKKTSNLASMNMTQLKATPVACPPIKFQQRFVDAAQRIVRTRDRQTAALHDSEQLFHSLVKRAFRGEL